LLLFAFEGSMLKKIAFLFIIFFSSFSFSQPAEDPPPRPEQPTAERIVDRRATTLPEEPPAATQQQSVSSGRKTQDKRKQQELVQQLAVRRKREEEELAKRVRSRGKKATGPDSGADNYQYSFSGADCKVYAGRGSQRSLLESVMTVSLSIYEAKAPVRRLGHAAPVGFTGNIRSIAGSIVCLMKGDTHPLGPVMMGYTPEAKHVDDENISSPYKQITGGEDYQWRFQAGLIKPFNLLLLYKNEVGGDVGLQINNIDIISESVVTSVNDIYTEMVFQFVATNVNPISKKPLKEKTEKP
jgi:hypothetical protein